MQWMDPYLDDRAQHVKRKHEGDNLSDFGDLDELGRTDSALGYMVVDKGRSGGADVLLDGDSAFAASAVSDLRTLPEHARALAKAQIESLLETGRMPITTGSY
uniref:BESS domain-containing protein n=1 Tax=Heterorhabditis bacteriophora TaxID=37862 RepID=A0A1I7XT80_HETBA